MVILGILGLVVLTFMAGFFCGYEYYRRYSLNERARKSVLTPESRVFQTKDDR